MKPVHDIGTIFTPDEMITQTLGQIISKSHNFYIQEYNKLFWDFVKEKAKLKKLTDHIERTKEVMRESNRCQDTVEEIFWLLEGGNYE